MPIMDYYILGLMYRQYSIYLVAKI